jgi:hypothetical protein
LNDELERTWKEVARVLFEVPSWHLSGGAKENHGEPVRIVYIPAKI